MLCDVRLHPSDMLTLTQRLLYSSSRTKTTGVGKTTVVSHCAIDVVKMCVLRAKYQQDGKNGTPKLYNRLFILFIHGQKFSDATDLALVQLSLWLPSLDSDSVSVAL